MGTIFTSLAQLYDVFVVETFHGDDDDDVCPPPPLARSRPRVVFFGVSASLFLDGEDGGVRVCGKTTDDDDARGGGKEREERVARLDFRLGRRLKLARKEGEGGRGGRRGEERRLFARSARV